MEEIELTYLPKFLPSGVLLSPFKKMLDIYIPESLDHPKLRLRRSGDTYEITKKNPISEGDASRQLEITIPLTAEEFADLEKIPGKRINKSRYVYKENNITFEIDVFQGDLKGLVLVDIEFKSVDDKSKFVSPPWCLVDVTQEKFIAGGMLCGKRYADIEERLNKFGYSKLDLK